MLPNTQPAHFQATYTPIAAAGTQAQIRHLSRLLATQLTAAGLGKGIHEVQRKTKVRYSYFLPDEKDYSVLDRQVPTWGEVHLVNVTKLCSQCIVHFLKPIKKHLGIHTFY